MLHVTLFRCTGGRERGNREMRERKGDGNDAQGVLRGRREMGEK